MEGIVLRSIQPAARSGQPFPATKAVNGRAAAEEVTIDGCGSGGEGFERPAGVLFPYSCSLLTHTIPGRAELSGQLICAGHAVHPLVLRCVEKGTPSETAGALRVSCRRLATCATLP